MATTVLVPPQGTMTKQGSPKALILTSTHVTFGSVGQVFVTHVLPGPAKWQFDFDKS